MSTISMTGRQKGIRGALSVFPPFYNPRAKGVRPTLCDIIYCLQTDGGTDVKHAQTRIPGFNAGAALLEPSSVSFSDWNDAPGRERALYRDLFGARGKRLEFNWVVYPPLPLEDDVNLPIVTFVLLRLGRDRVFFLTADSNKRNYIQNKKAYICMWWFDI